MLSCIRPIALRILLLITSLSRDSIDLEAALELGKSVLKRFVSFCAQDFSAIRCKGQFLSSTETLGSALKPGFVHIWKVLVAQWFFKDLRDLHGVGPHLLALIDVEWIDESRTRA